MLQIRDIDWFQLSVSVEYSLSRLKFNYTEDAIKELAELQKLIQKVNIENTNMEK